MSHKPFIDGDADAQYANAKNAALRLLSYRARSEEEVRRRLRSRFTGEAIDRTPAGPPRRGPWVHLGPFVDLLGTLAAMNLLGRSLNFLTMFGLIVVLGLLVDDAIVVAENIMTRHEAGESALTAAVNGATQVQWPVFATVLTTIAAFLPLRAIQPLH